MTSPYHVGIKFDRWTPAVEGALFRDLVQLQDKTELIVICESSEADRLLKSLGIQRLSLETLASLWILYQVEEEVEAPESAEEYITRNFIVETRNMQIALDPRAVMDLPPQGRANHYNPFEQTPPANTGGLPVDPRVALLFT